MPKASHISWAKVLSLSVSTGTDSGNELAGNEGKKKKTSIKEKKKGETLIRNGEAG